MQSLDRLVKWVLLSACLALCAVCFLFYTTVNELSVMVQQQDEQIQKMMV
jgi:hypothetical protein